MHRLESVLERIAELRSLGALHRTAELLRQVLKEDLATDAEEILRFELGGVLGELNDVEATCRHWANHRERFENVNYIVDVNRAWARLRCDRILR